MISAGRLSEVRHRLKKIMKIIIRPRPYNLRFKTVITHKWLFRYYSVLYINRFQKNFNKITLGCFFHFRIYIGNFRGRGEGCRFENKKDNNIV